MQRDRDRRRAERRFVARRNSMVEYLLDTSVIRGAPKALLEAARAKRLRLLASPMSVWEILSNFKEEEETSFERCRGWMRRLGFCEIVDHPDAEIRDAIGVTPHIPPHARIAWRERAGARVIVEIFQDASSAEDVHRRQKEIGDPNATESCGTLARQQLERLEAGYAADVRPVAEGLRAEFRRLERDPRDEQSFSDGEFFEHVRREVERIAGTADTPTIPWVKERIFEYAFARIGHALETTLSLLRRGAALDTNDYEDALICNHVDLAGERILVTSDRGSQQALSRAEARLRRYAKEHGFKTRISPFVIDIPTFQARIADAAPLA
jgi:hypothetical protein